LLTFGCEIKGKFDAIFQDLDQSKKVFEKLISGEFISGECFEKFFDAKKVSSGLSLGQPQGEKQNCEQPRMEIPVRYANISEIKPKSAVARNIQRKSNKNNTSLERLDTIRTEPFNTAMALPGKFTKPPKNEYRF
jgi:hypothetical protein